MSDVSFRGWYLENRTANHHKFYLVLISDDGLVVMNWGRIGTTGQSKIQRLPSAEDAEALGMRQVYSKRSGGYEMKFDNIPFLMEEANVTFVETRSYHTLATNAFWQATRDPEFQKQKEVVLSHYADLLKKAQTLMDQASDMNFEQVQTQYEELEKAWAEIQEKHSEVEITMNFTQQMLGARLMSGQL